MDRDLRNQPKNYPLGFSSFFVYFPVEKSSWSYSMWFRTIHNIDWNFNVNSTKSDETNNIFVTISQKEQPNPLHSIELEACVVLENRDNLEYNIKAQGTYEFSGKDKTEMKLELAGFDKMIDWKQGYFDDKAAKKEFKIRVMAVVKSMKLCDSVEYLNLFNFDPTIHDVEVNVMGHKMCLSKKLVALQSPYFANLLDTQNIELSDLPAGMYFDIFFEFLQVVHGVDLSLDSGGLESFLKLANHLQVPRVTEYCKQQMVKGCRGMTINKTIEVAEAWSFWDIVPRKLHEATCLKELKEQKWDLDTLPDSVIEMITRRMFELSC